MDQGLECIDSDQATAARLVGSNPTYSSYPVLVPASAVLHGPCGRRITSASSTATGEPAGSSHSAL